MIVILSLYIINMLPRQRTTTKEKYALINKDKSSTYNWFHQNADYFIDQFNYDNQQEEITKIQNAVEGILPLEEFDYLLSPLKMDNGRTFKVGAVLRNHNILKGIANLLTGEYQRRVHDYTVTSFNPTAESTYKEGLAAKMHEYKGQALANAFAEEGVDTGVPPKEQPSPEQVEEEYRASFEAERVMFGQHAIDYLKNNLDIDIKSTELYYDWITVGQASSFKCIRDNDVDYEYVPANEIYVPFNVNTYIEDAPFVVRRRNLPLSTILDFYGDFLSPEDIDKLEKDYDTNVLAFANARNVPAGDRGFIRLPSIDASCDTYVTKEEAFYGIPLYHVQWRSFEKIGTLTYQDPLGQIQTIEVDDTYTLDKTIGDISIEWRWDTCICECTRIGEDMYVLDRIVEENRGKLEGRGGKKLLYNGIRARSKSGSINSPIKDGIPYQVLINGLHYQLEKIIHKNKDKVLVLPYGLIPRKKGINTKEAIQTMDNTSILWIDETAPNASLAAQMIKSVDMSLGNYIKDTYSIIALIKQEYWDSIGMNAQRFSDVSQTAGKGVTEQAIIRSAIITHDMNKQMDKLLEKDYQGMLDLSKLAWINGKKGKYVLTDGSESFLNLNPDDALYHAESEYGVFVKDSAELSEGLQALRTLAAQYAQQSGGTSAAAEIMFNNNPEKIKHIVAKIEENNKKHEAYIAEISGKQQNELQDKIAADKEKDRELERYKIDMTYQGIVDSAEIRTKNNSRNEPRPANDVERVTAQAKIQKSAIDAQQKERELEQRDVELALKNKQIETQKSKANGR